MDHLGELRRRLTIIIVSLFATAIVLYFATPVLIDFLLAPVQEFLPTDAGVGGISSETGLFVTSPLGGFAIRFKVAIFCAFCVCSPIVLWEVMAFFLPALKPNERRWVVPTLAVGVFLFVFGVVFGYNFILGPAFGWMTNESDMIGAVLPDAQTYLNAIIGFMIAFGVAFELPLVVFYLVIFDIVPYKKLRSSWRTVYIVLMVISAMATPDASPVTMLLMFGAMIVLYEASLLVARIVLGNRLKKRQEEEAREAAEDAEIAAEWDETKKKAKKKFKEHMDLDD